MSIDKDNLRELIIRPTLIQLSMYSDAAENEMMGTAAAESALGSYLKQMNGPALGIYQMEPKTYHSIWDNFIAYRRNLRDKIMYICNLAMKPEADEMMHNLKFATVMARLKYWKVSTPLPAADDIDGLAQYWKNYYNTQLGRGTVKHFIDSYKRYVS